MPRKGINKEIGINQEAYLGRLLMINLNMNRKRQMIRLKKLTDSIPILILNIKFLLDKFSLVKKDNDWQIM